jgi:hypothetical protein
MITSGREHVAPPFTTPGLEFYDALRVFCVVGGTVVAIGMVVQFLALQSGISRRLQRARGTFILGTFFFVLSDINVEVERFGQPPLMVRLVASTAGVATLLAWMVFEQQARRRDPQDRLRRLPDRPDPAADP